jgi:hypothetical protein
MEALRGSDGALRVPDLTARVMAVRGHNAADKRLAHAMQKRVGAALRHMRAGGKVRSEPRKERRAVLAVPGFPPAPLSW